ncbi:MAG: twin-arginine translocase TatA/TatE family subunit [Ktedonobacteraceae bacterium]
MIPGFHGFDLIVILIIALLIFGPKKLPEMGSAIGKSIKEFRKGMNELTQPKHEEEEFKLPVAKDTVPVKPGLGSVPYEGEMSVPSSTVNNEAQRSEHPVD